MTQAFNLSQFANNLDPSGRVDAADGLINAVPVTNGGTGATTAAAARTNLGVPSVAGAGATGVWPIDITACQLNAFTIVEVGNKMYFRFNGTNVASLDSAGNFTTLANTTAFGTP